MPFSLRLLRVRNYVLRNSLEPLVGEKIGKEYGDHSKISPASFSVNPIFPVHLADDSSHYQLPEGFASATTLKDFKKEDLSFQSSKLDLTNITLRRSYHNFSYYSLLMNDTFQPFHPESSLDNEDELSIDFRDCVVFEPEIVDFKQRYLLTAKIQ